MGCRRLGVHTSIAGGIHLSLERARELGCSTMQIFSHNPRQWHVRKIPEEDILQFRELRRAFDIDPVFIHASYLINLASANAGILDRSVQLIVREMELADSLEADYVVLHTGSVQGDGAEGRRRATEALKIISKSGKWNSGLLLENTAGEKGDISSRIENLAEIIDKAHSAAIGGICFDTCHGFQAGYDISKKNGLAELVDEIGMRLGPGKVKLIHLNDSKRDFNSRVDRHEHIGMGGIGEEGLKRFLRHPLFEKIPVILETPKKSDEDDPRNLKAVRRLVK